MFQELYRSRAVSGVQEHLLHVAQLERVEAIEVNDIAGEEGQSVGLHDGLGVRPVAHLGAGEGQIGGQEDRRCGGTWSLQAQASASHSSLNTGIEKVVAYWYFSPGIVVANLAHATTHRAALAISATYPNVQVTCTIGRHQLGHLGAHVLLHTAPAPVNHPGVCV